MKVIGFTSPDGVQIMMTDKSLEVYDKGVVRSTFNITSESGKLVFQDFNDLTGSFTSR